MIPLGPVVARSRTKASRAVVWAHLTDANLRAQWWEGLQVEPGLGGAVRSLGESLELVGVIDVWVAGHALGFTWQAEGEERGTAVLITLRSQGHHTGVTVTETGFDALRDGAARAEAAGREWARFVEGLTDASLAEVEAAVEAAALVGVGVAAGGVESGGAAAAAGTGVAGADVGPGAVAAAGAARAAGTDASELELAPLEVEGELSAGEAVDPIEVDAEPGLGDRLELVTAPIELPSGVAGAEVLPSERGLAGDGENASEDALPEGLVPLVLPEPHAAGLVLPAPLADASIHDPSSANDDTVVLERVAAEAAPSTEEPDAANDEPASAGTPAPAPTDEDEPDEPDFDSLLRGL